MGSCGLRALAAGSLAAVGIAALGVSPAALAPGIRTAQAAVQLADTVGLGMGGSGTPIPSQELIDEIMGRFGNPDPPFFPGQPLFPVDSARGIFTPEGLYPITGVKSLPLDTSVAQGVTMLHSAIMGELGAGNDVVVAGGSQSSTIASVEMRNLLALPEGAQPSADQLSFMLLVDPSNPNGGMLARFGDPSLPPLSFPSMGITFSGATPADTPWDTAIYNVEYDGFSDFPRYPLNFLSVLNALAGIVFVHSEVEHLSDELTRAIVELPVSEDYLGHTQYFMVPTEDLPLLEPLRFLPVLGDPLADLIQPAMKVLVNLGYGNIEHGWDPGPANLPTPFGLFPTDLDWGEVFTALVNGVKQGVNDFADDLGSLSMPGIAAELTAAADAMPSFIDLVNGFSGALSAGYAALLPAADAINALLTSLPMYAAGLFMDGLESGNLLDAIGMPLAALSGLVPTGIGFALLGAVDAVKAIAPDLVDLF